MKHTPRPWKAHLNAPLAAIPGHLIKRDDDVMQPIASLWEGGGTKGKPEQIANAHLIAAAPDLLEVIKDIVCDLQFSDVPTHRNLVKMARAVIAKAGGK